MKTPEKFRLALEEENPLQIVGVINPFVALMAKKVGFKALYLSGASVANFFRGLPDEGLTTLDDVVQMASRITASCDLPLLVDLDTGFDIEEAVHRMIAYDVAAVHIEDQIENKRCGHLKGKELVSIEEMCKRIRKAANQDLIIMARIDAYASEGLSGTIERGLAYLEAGADMLFPEALPTLEDFAAFKQAVEAPILANITEFGKTPLFALEELEDAKIDMALYPLTVARTMNQAALHALETLYDEGTQKDLLPRMQTREELYAFLRRENG